MGEDALAFVVSHNLVRRHLSESQRGMIGARVATIKNGSNRYTLGSSIDEPRISTQTRDAAAAQLNVGTATVDRARRVIRDGVEELVHAVDSGEVSVNAAVDSQNRRDGRLRVLFTRIDNAA